MKRIAILSLLLLSVLQPFSFASNSTMALIPMDIAAQGTIWPSFQEWFDTLPVWAKLIPLILICTGTIIALVFNCKGKAVIFVNVLDLLLFIVSIVLVAIGEIANMEISNYLMLAGLIGFAISGLWTIIRSIRFGINPILIILSLFAKIFFLYLFLVLIAFSIVKTILTPKDNEFTISSDNETWTVRVPKSDIELEYYANKSAEAVAPLIALFLSRLHIKKQNNN